LAKCLSFGAVLLLLASLPMVSAQKSSGGVPTAALEQILKQRYPLTVVGKGMFGMGGTATSVRKTGAVVAVRRPGWFAAFDTRQSATMGMRGQKVSLLRGSEDYAVPPGERYYVHSIFVGSDFVSFGLLTARQIRTAHGTARLWTEAVFFFPPDVVNRGDEATIFRTIDEWIPPEGVAGISPAPAAAAAAPASLAAAAPPPAPPAAIKLAPGMTRAQVIAALGQPEHEITFGTRTWLEYTGLVAVLEGGKLSAVEPAISSAAEVTVASQPEAAEIYLDGKLAGSTPSTLKLPAGDHRVTLRLAGYQDWEQTLHVLAESRITLQADLQKK
jgi:PEGA domain/SmpA / OmlA family